MPLNVFYENSAPILHSTSRIHTIENEVIKNNSYPIFNYFDSYYRSSKCDWKTEPKETLSELYAARAQQIRDEYGYVILAYSGGVDSTNILETFVKNQIKIDEILVMGAFSKDKDHDDDSNKNLETYRNVMPTLQKLGLKSKINYVDHSLFYEEYQDLKMNDNEYWKQHCGGYYSLWKWVWHDLHELVYPRRKNKYALVLGIDKPRLFKNEHGYYTRFVDRTLVQYGHTIERYNHPEENILCRTNFYWGPKAFPVLLKQLYTLKKFREFTQTSESELHTYDKAIPSLIYDLKYQPEYVGAKSGPIFSIRDNFLLSEPDSGIMKSYFEKMSMLTDIEKHKQVVETRKYYLS